jgi:hypothetical protein
VEPGLRLAAQLTALAQHAPLVAVGNVAYVVQGLDLPVAADPLRELSGRGLGERQAGDSMDGDRPPPAAA